MKYKKVLIRANTGGIGDFVWATSAISLIKQFDKNIDITLITSNSFIPLIDKKIDIKNILSCNRNYNHSKNKFVKVLYRLCWCVKNYFKIKKEKYDLMLFLDHCYITSFFAKYIYKIQNIAGPAILPYGYNTKNNSSKFYTQVVDLPLDFDRLHCMMAYQIITRKIFPTYNLSLPMLPNTDSFAQEIKQKFLQNTNKYKIAICLRGNLNSQNWDIDNFKNLIEETGKIFDVSFFVIGNSEQEEKDAVYLKNNLKNINIKNLVKQTNLLELIELLKNMDLLISVDTGIVHIASVFKKKMICLYGQSLPERTGAVNSNAISLCTYETCSPCVSSSYKYKKVCNNVKCMQNITVEMVIDKVKEIVNERK